MGAHKQRVTAFQAVYMYGLNSPRKRILSENEILENFLSPSENLPSSEKIKVAIDLFHCVVEHQEDIDRIIEKNAKNVDMRTLSWVLVAILRLAVAELLFLSEPTEKALVIDEAIILAKTYGESNSYLLINAILDKINP